jgi:hypothetical protein
VYTEVSDLGKFGIAIKNVGFCGYNWKSVGSQGDPSGIESFS